MSCNSQSCSLGHATTALPELNIPPVRRLVYESVAMYYGNPTMTKVFCQSDRYSMYVVGSPSQCADRRYLFAIKDYDGKPYGHTSKLADITWVSFQARVSVTPYSVPNIHTFGNTNSFIDTPIFYETGTQTSTTYKVQGFPLKIELLGPGSGYSLGGTVRQALESYNTNMFFA